VWNLSKNHVKRETIYRDFITTKTGELRALGKRKEKPEKGDKRKKK